LALRQSGHRAKRVSVWRVAGVEPFEVAEKRVPLPALHVD